MEKVVLYVALMAGALAYPVRYLLAFILDPEGGGLPWDS